MCKRTLNTDPDVLALHFLTRLTMHDDEHGDQGPQSDQLPVSCVPVSVGYRNADAVDAKANRTRDIDFISVRQVLVLILLTAKKTAKIHPKLLVHPDSADPLQKCLNKLSDHLYKHH